MKGPGKNGPEKGMVPASALGYRRRRRVTGAQLPAAIIAYETWRLLEMPDMKKCARIAYKTNRL